MDSVSLDAENKKDLLGQLVLGWKTMFPGYPVRRVLADTLEIGVSGEGSVFIQDMKMAAGIPRLMVFTKMPLDPKNTIHETHWYRVSQILNTDIRGVTFIYNNNDLKMGQPVLTLRSSLAIGLSGKSIDMIALYCEVVAIFEAKRIMQEVLNVSLRAGILRTDMYDQTEGQAQSIFQVIHPGASSVKPFNGKNIWLEMIADAGTWSSMSVLPEGQGLRVTLETDKVGVVGYHDETHTLTLDHIIPTELSHELLNDRSGFEISEFLNILHLLHPMGCFEFDLASGVLKYGSLLRLVKAPTPQDVETLANEIDAVHVMLGEILRYQQEMNGGKTPSAA